MGIVLELIWTFDYIKIDKELTVASSRQYKNGKYVGEVDAQEKLMLLSYLALFPNKDIARIKLDTSQNSLYTIFYLDKRFTDKNFIGVFSFSEYNSSKPFIWGKEDEIMHEIFDSFHEKFPDMFSKSGEYSLDMLNEYYIMMDLKINTFYEEWQKAKEKFYGKKEQDIRHQLADTFSQVSAHNSIQEIRSGNAVTPTKISTKKKSTVQEIKSNHKKIRPIKLSSSSDKNNGHVNLINNLVGQMLKPHERPSDYNPLNYTRIWELQLINAFGNPLTHIIRFKDGQFIENGKDEFMAQGLEAMSFSVLKSIVEQKNLNLRHIKAKIDSKGFEFVFFQNVNFGTNNLLIIMRSMTLEKKTNTYIEDQLGGERRTLERIAFELKNEKNNWFTHSEFNRNIPDIAHEVESLFYRNCRKFFKELENK